MKKLCLSIILCFVLIPAVSAREKNIELRDLIVMTNGDSIRCHFTTVMNYTRTTYKITTFDERGEKVLSVLVAEKVASAVPNYYGTEKFRNIDGQALGDDDRFPFRLGFHGGIGLFKENVRNSLWKKGHSKVWPFVNLDIAPQYVFKDNRNAVGLLLDYTFGRKAMPDYRYRSDAFFIAPVYSHSFDPYEVKAKPYLDIALGYFLAKEKWGGNTLREDKGLGVKASYGYFFRAFSSGAFDIKASLNCQFSMWQKNLFFQSPNVYGNDLNLKVDIIISLGFVFGKY